MPVAGRKPKPEGQKRNRVKPAYDWVEVLNAPFKGRAPALSKGPGWPAATKRWWQVVSRMPHCVLWTESDWQFALDTAVLVAAFHSGDLRVATELRNRERLLGTTFDSRRDLRIRYVDAEGEERDEEATVTAIADYRAMLDE